MDPLVYELESSTILDLCARVCPLAGKCGATCQNFLVLSLASIYCLHFHMGMPAMNFVAVCANANLPFPTTKARQQTLLIDSGTMSSASLSTAEIKERAASLVWVRHAVAN